MDKDFIKDSFDDFMDDALPPSNLWNSIEDELDSGVTELDDASIQNSFLNAYDQEPSEEIWQNIDEELTLDQVWDNINTALNEDAERGRRNNLYLISLLALLLFFKPS